MIDWRERKELIEARGAEYRAGEMSEEMFRAYLFCMRYRGEDLRLEMGAWAPPPPAKTFEEHRLVVSREWIKEYLCRKR